MPKTPIPPNFSSDTLLKLHHLLDTNQSIDWRAFSFSDPNLNDKLAELGLESAREELIPLLKAYQRLLHILPLSEDHRALPLLAAGFHSAVQIANTPEDEFAHIWSTLFPNEAPLGDAVRAAAVARRSVLLLHHISTIQANEPHYRAARFK